MSSASPAPGSGSKPTTKPKPSKSTDDAGGSQGGRGESGKSRSKKGGKRSDARLAVEVELEHARSRQVFWGIAGLLFGCMLTWKFGVVGKGLGVLLLGIAGWNIRGVAATVLHPPGTIRITPENVELPQGLCRKQAQPMPFDKVRHAFFLRRAVPWTRSGPVLIIETADHTFAYPRDWFATEADQRRVCTTLNTLLGRS